VTVKSVIDIDLQGSDEFQEFAALFARYQEQLAKTPSAWADASKEAKASYSTFTHIAAALMTQNALTKKREGLERETGKRLKENSGYWDKMVRGSREFASNVTGITRDLLRWASLGSIFTGLVGAGSLFGLDRLADNVNAQRRASMGMGMTYGERRAFEVDYGRVVEPGSFLSGVQESLQDPSKRGALYAAGLSERDIAGKDTAEVGTALISKIKDLVDRTDPRYLQTVVQSLGLTQFGSLQDFQRLKATPRAELGEYAAAYQKDKTVLGLDPRGQKVWQDFSVQMTRAKSKIENVFVRGLEPLINPLNHLSESVVKAIDTFMSSKKLGSWIEEFGKGIEHVASYLSDDFQRRAQNFAEDIGALASAMADGLRALGVLPQRPGDRPPFDFKHGAGGVVQSTLDRAEAGGINTHLFFGTGKHPTPENVGNLRPVGASSGYKLYPNQEAGIRDLAADLRYKARVRHLDTISKIIDRYASGPGDDPESYKLDVSQTTGFGIDQPLDLGNNQVLSSFMASVIKHEKGFKNKIPKEAILRVLEGSQRPTATTRRQQDSVGIRDVSVGAVNAPPPKHESTASQVAAAVSAYMKFSGKIGKAVAGGETLQEEMKRAHESKKAVKHKSPPSVTLRVQNETGGNVVVQSSQLTATPGLRSTNAR
jgi:hypothetical protein